jgi:hypothetical protein
MWTVRGQLFHQGVPVQFNNWNRAFAGLYADAKREARAILMTGDLIDYGRGHVGLIDGGRHRHELGLDHRYHPDRNWFLFYYLLASGGRYTQPVYTSLGNHDWRLNPYPPFAPGAPSPWALIHNHRAQFDNPVRRKALKEIIEIAHGPGHDKSFAYPDLDLRRIARGAAGYLIGDLDIPGSPVQTNVDSVIWYLLLINPFLDYAFAHPGGQQILMLDWAEDEELFNHDAPRDERGLSERAANSLTPLQEWHVSAFARAPGRAKLIGIHAPPLGPSSDWNDDDLVKGEKSYPWARAPLMRRPYEIQRTRVTRHGIFAVAPKGQPVGVAAEYGSIVRRRDWFVREVARPGAGIRLVLSGHIHRFGLLAAYPARNDPQTLLMKSVNLQEVQGAGPGRASRFRNFPGPLYLNTTSAGPRGNVYAPPWRSVAPGWSLVTLAADGRIEAVAPRQLQVLPPVVPPPAREVARFLQGTPA